MSFLEIIRKLVAERFSLLVELRDPIDFLRSVFLHLIITPND